MWGVGLVAVIIVIGAAWMLIRKGTGSPSAGTSSSTAQTSNAPQTQTTTLRSLIAANTPQMCTFSKTTAQMQSQGTVYVGNGMMRGDFTTYVAGQTTESHMIVKDNTSYMWTSVSPQGFKMSFDQVATQSDTNPNPTLDPSAPTDYSCSSWSYESTQFELPTTVTFRDMSAMMPPSMPR
jgi:DNA-binding transcriptional regulator of glucitol operon